MTRLRTYAAAAACAAAVCACAAHGGDSPQDLADSTTRAVYAADYDGTVAHFDDTLKTQVTRQSIGTISDTMHRLGAYQSVSQKSANADKGEYRYDAAFDHGHMMVELRMDPDGKIGAYRVIPLTQ